MGKMIAGSADRGPWGPDPCLDRGPLGAAGARPADPSWAWARPGRGPGGAASTPWRTWTAPGAVPARGLQVDEAASPMGSRCPASGRGSRSGDAGTVAGRPDRAGCGRAGARRAGQHSSMRSRGQGSPGSSSGPSRSRTSWGSRRMPEPAGPGIIPPPGRTRT